MYPSHILCNHDFPICSSLCDGRTVTKNLSVPVQVPKSVTQRFNMINTQKKNGLV